MKIRISGNSLRLRLSQTEIIQFVHDGEVSSACQLGQNSLIYKIKHGDHSGITANFVGDTITAHVPASLVKNWDTDERVGFDATDQNGLYILIEKDFQCLKPRPHEDETDLFPNPQSSVSFHG